MKIIKTSEVVFRDDLYPRIRHSQEKAQEYSEHLECLPPIEINQRCELIDGFHRWTAHRLRGLEQIQVTVTETTSDNHLLSLAIQRNAAHGLQLSQADKRRMAIRFYATKEFDKDGLATLLAVSLRTVQEWVSDLDAAEREARREKILALYLRCYTAEEIGQQVGLTHQQVDFETKALLQETADLPKSAKVTFSDDFEIKALLVENADLRKLLKVTFSEEGFQKPIYNVWAFAKKTNETSHFGNTEQRIVDNLLYLYTEPNDIVIDPFGGGGTRQ